MFMRIIKMAAENIIKSVKNQVTSCTY